MLAVGVEMDVGFIVFVASHPAEEIEIISVTIKSITFFMLHLVSRKYVSYCKTKQLAMNNKQTKSPTSDTIDNAILCNSAHVAHVVL